MTHTTVGSVEKENRGSQTAFVHQINITSLDAAGQENYSPSSELGVPEDSELQVTPVAQTNESVVFTWNATGDHLNVKNLGDGSDVANNGDPGEVRLLVVGGGV